MDLIGSILSAPFICIGWLIVGAIAGAVARQLMKDSDEPLVADIVLGLIGAVVGGFIIGLLGFYRPDGGLTAILINLVVAIVGAVVVLAAWRLARGKSIR